MSTLTYIAVILIIGIGLGIGFWGGIDAPPASQSNRYVSPTAPGEKEVMTVRLADTSVTAEIARTKAERVRGLSGRAALAAGRGMLFIFPASGRHGIWMRDMNFAIDIIWLNEAKKIVHLKRSVSPDTYPESFRPSEPARYVLELSAGWSAEHGLRVGDTVRW